MNEIIKRLNKEFIVINTTFENIRVKISAITEYWISVEEPSWTLHINILGEPVKLHIDTGSKESLVKTINCLDNILTDYYGTVNKKQKNKQISSEIL